jgi:hypothetical protein
LTAAELESLPDHTRVLLDYVYGGYVTARRSAYDVCGERWRLPSTLYRFADGTILQGDQVAEGSIPKNTLVFYRP